MGKLPKITIITPTLNASKTIEACVLSVKNQSYTNKEHLIIDGQSTDDTLNILKKYAESYPQIRWVSEKDEGIYDAMNKGIDMSSGDWLYFLGSDDIFYSDKVLDEIFNQIDTSKFDVIYGNVEYGDTGQLYDGPFSGIKLLQKNICHQAIFTRNTVFDSIGKFDINYKIWADWLFNMQWYSNQDIRHYYIDIIIAKFALNGYCSKYISDTIFMKNKDAIMETYFPQEYSICRELDNKIANLAQELKKLSESRSWRITRPLRQAGVVIRNCRKLLVLCSKYIPYCKKKE